MNPKVHVSLDVHNVEDSVRFYSTLFGAQPTKPKPGYAKFDLEQPAINLTMQAKKRCCLQGLSHMGIRVDSNEQVLAYRQRLAAAGVPTLEEKEVVCCHGLQGKTWTEDQRGCRCS